MLLKLLTCHTTEWRTPPEWRTLPRPHLFPPSITMSQQSDLELLSSKDRVIMANYAIKSDALLSQQRAAAIYNVPETTL
jgi:hypothetical protein